MFRIIIRIEDQTSMDPEMCRHRILDPRRILPRTAYLYSFLATQADFQAHSDVSLAAD